MPGKFDLWTVLFSFSIASLAGFVAFESIAHTRFSKYPALWTFVSGLTLGLGIWSMHYIGMLAWEPPYPLYYAVSDTLWSVVLAVAASWLAIHLTVNHRDVSPRSQLMGAVLVGAGISGMHYLGMAALHFSIAPAWSIPGVLLSCLLAVLVSLAAMVLLQRSGGDDFGTGPQVGASLAIGFAISGMHYTGMMAMMLPAGAVCLPQPHAFTGTALVRLGVGNALIFMACLLVVFSRDKIRLLRTASNARFEAQQASLNVERLGAAGKIAASIAHEINNPLEAVTNLLYLAEHGTLGDPEREYLRLAQSELSRIAEITTHTLKFHRQQSAPTATWLPDLFQSALTVFQKRIEANGITVTEEFDPATPNVVCRAGEIRQVFANLVSNAIDAMPGGGTLLLRVRPAPMGMGSEIEVADTGTGISEAAQGRILEPFFTTKGASGTGLGLSISAEILERHGGTLHFQSSTEAGSSGTRFLLFLPVAGALSK